MNFVAAFLWLQYAGGIDTGGSGSVDSTAAVASSASSSASSSLSASPEECAFWSLNALFHRYDLAGCFSVGLPRLQLCMAQWEAVLALHHPRIAQRLVRDTTLCFSCDCDDRNARVLVVMSSSSSSFPRAFVFFLVRYFSPSLPALAQSTIGLHASMYASEWFLTLFSYRLPLHTAARVWDTFVVDGIAALMRVGLALVAAHEGAGRATVRRPCLSGRDTVSAHTPCCSRSFSTGNSQSHAFCTFVMHVMPFSRHLQSTC